jgi:hypothetical protein
LIAEGGHEKVRDRRWPIAEHILEVVLIILARAAIPLRQTGGGEPISPTFTDREPTEFVTICEAGPELRTIGLGLHVGDGPPGRVAAIGELERATELAGHG